MSRRANAVAAPDAPPSLPPLSRLEVLRGLHVSTWEGIWATIHGVLTGGAFQTGFALMLGANPFALGILAGLPAAVGLLQLPAAVWTERAGERRRFVALPAFTGRLLWVGILLIPFLLPPSLRLGAFLALLTLSSALLTITVPAWTSWMSDLTPPESRGAYFGRRNMLMGIVTMLVPLPAGAFLDQAVKYNRFAPRLGFGVLFLLACGAAVGSFLLLRRQPEPPVERKRDANAPNPLRSLTAPLADANFRRFLTFCGVTVLGQTIAGQFFTAWQLDRHALALPYLTVQILGAVSAAAALVSTQVWGYLADKYGSRPVLALAGAGIVIAPLLWVLTVPRADALFYNLFLIVVLNLFSGAFWAGVGLAQFNLLLGLAAPQSRATYVAMFSAFTGILGGISPVVGGALMALLEPVAVTIGPLTLNNYKILFIVAALIRLGALFLVNRVREEEGHSTRYVMEQLANARPVSAYRSLRRLTRPSGEEERLQAVERLAELKTPLAVEELAAALEDVSPDVRERAARALGRIADARATPALIAKLNDPAAGIGELVAVALGRIGDPNAADALAEAARGPDAGLRVAALRALGQFANAAESHPLIAETLRQALSPSHPTACEAACATLTAIGTSLPSDQAARLFPLLLGLLSPEVARGMRLASARALESLAPFANDTAFDVVRDRLAEETDSAVMAQEADTLESIGRATNRQIAEPLAALVPLLDRSPLTGLAYKQTLEAIADVGLSPGSFYSYLGLKEMERDETFRRVLGEIDRRLKTVNGVPLAERTRTELLEQYSSGDYRTCLQTLARLVSAFSPGPARATLIALNAALPARRSIVHAEEALLALLLVRECVAGE